MKKLKRYKDFSDKLLNVALFNEEFNKLDVLSRYNRLADFLELRYADCILDEDENAVDLAIKLLTPFGGTDEDWERLNKFRNMSEEQLDSLEKTVGEDLKKQIKELLGMDDGFIKFGDEKK